MGGWEATKTGQCGDGWADGKVATSVYFMEEEQSWLKRKKQRNPSPNELSDFYLTCAHGRKQTAWGESNQASLWGNRAHKELGGCLPAFTALKRTGSAPTLEELAPLTHVLSGSSRGMIAQLYFTFSSGPSP